MSAASSSGAAPPGGGGLPRLGPAWRSSGPPGAGPRGFQPPPAVPDGAAARGPPQPPERERSGSHASTGSAGDKGDVRGDKSRVNPFGVLDEEDDHRTLSPSRRASVAAGDRGGDRSAALGGSGGGGGRFSALAASSPGRTWKDDRRASTGTAASRGDGGGSGPPPRRLGGRSLADLAAGLSDRARDGGGDGHRHLHGGDPRAHSHHGPPRRPTDRRDDGGAGVGSGAAAAGRRGYSFDDGPVDAEASTVPVIRYTRERILSLRGRGDDPIPACVAALEGSVVVSATAQDPVCWDTFDAEEIWATAAGTHRRASDHRPKNQSTGRLRDFDSGDEDGPPRGGFGDRGSLARSGSAGAYGERSGQSAAGGGRWQRGVALPEGDLRPSSRGRTGSDPVSPPRRGSDFETEDPDDLWDDPTAGLTGGGTGAAADFSAFGGSLDDERPLPPQGKTGMQTFHMGDMSRAAAAFESEMRGENGGTEGSRARENGSNSGLTRHVDSSRPLASTGTTIRSGSGAEVSVFEDFGDESNGEEVAPSSKAESAEEEEELPIKSGNEENNASSRLMKMIGVAGTGEAASGSRESPVAEVAEETADAAPEEPEEDTKPRANSIASVPSNPWGAPATTLSSNPWGGAPSGGGMTLDSFSASQQAAKEAEAVAAQRQREEELLRQQREQQQMEEEEKKRWAVMQAKQQAEMQAVAAAQQQQAQQRQQHEQQIEAQRSQVELVLIERISNILENSWGRSDLTSILTTLHANDSRVIAILSTVEALRALISRHPERIQLGRDPTMGAEMAALRLTNLQWQERLAVVAAQEQQAKIQEQQQQQAEMAERVELQRRRALQEEQQAQRQAAQREEEERKKQQGAQQQAAAPLVITDAPWYYADPQGNIQGPFGGDEMRQWLEAGYFKLDLPISQNPAGPFRSLGSYFSNAESAFQSPSPPAAQAGGGGVKDEAAAETVARAALAEAEARARAEAGEQAREAARRESAAAEEAAARAEARARAEAEAQARVEAQREKDVAGRSEQSAQLKMMLGLGAALDGTSPSEEAVIAGLPPSESAPAVRAPAKKQSKKKKDQLQTLSSSPNEVTAPVQASAPEPAPAPVAWGGATAKVARKKSMSEIQQEEAREAARRAREQGISLSGPRGNGGGGGGGGQRGGGGWANVAASGGSTAWGGAALKPPAVAAVVPTPMVAGAQQAWSKQPVGAATGKKLSLQKTNSSKNAAVDDFGMNGRMSPTLETWCKGQMQKLNGSDDLTLVSFCMTLTDKDEIRQYLTAYLGSTKQVNNFATEFIRHRGLTSREEETWESAGGPKGKRGKKKGGK